MNRDRKAGKTYRIGWDEWIEICRENREDPREAPEINIGLDGGNFCTVKLDGDPPAREGENGQ